jgi:hypothetical protein
LRALFRLLSLMDYDYSVVDSMKLTHWLRRLHELFINVRVRSGDTLYPVHAQPTSPEVESVKVYLKAEASRLGTEHSTLSPC